MKYIKAFFLLALVIGGCELNNDDNDNKEIPPPPPLPAAIYGQLPTGAAIIQAAEAVGAANVEIIYYQTATGISENADVVNTSGGFQPNWWREDRRWRSDSYSPTLTRVKVVYDETDNMHSGLSVQGAIYRLFENAGFSDASGWWPCPVEVETTTDDNDRLLLLPTHAAIINAVEQLGASNVKINLYIVARSDYLGPLLTIGYITYPHYQHVPTDSSFSAQRNAGKILGLSYEHPGLGSIITNNDVEDAIKELFSQYGFASVDVAATGTQISAGFPLPSFSQIMQAAERAGAANVEVSTYIANNTTVIPMNEGSRVANTPVILEISYDGAAITAVNASIQALFVNFNNVHIGNNAVAKIPLPSGSEIRRAALNALYFPADLNEPSIYTVNGESIWPEFAVLAPWNASIIIGIRGDGSNDAVYANLAFQNLNKLFIERGFFNLHITVNYP